ncbi:hypothetical protein [Paludisphaera borealis]|uniref:hypothetical protein n=1 Tax=Paludisphaera borealis TaxID=1387353 RepID=UPI0011AB472A|nr:hypothetical protein [Paludisphaera borealis]
MSRPSPAGFFTLGVPPERYRLPHRRIDLPVILLVRRVLHRALIRLRKIGFNLCDASEDQVTAALLDVIENDFRRTGCIPGFNTKVYESVVRQTQVANYDRTKIGKAPDLCFRLQPDDQEEYWGLSIYDALFVECKPVDKTHSAGGDYCDKGLVRFIEGDYAWAMQDAMMVAYARHDRSVVGHLLPAMKEADRITTLATERMPQLLKPINKHKLEGTEPIYVSLHRRAFDWPDGKGKATNITVYHLWFDCN